MNTNTSTEELLNRYKQLELEDDVEEIPIIVPTLVAPLPEFYYVGELCMKKDFNELSFQRTISKLWEPRIWEGCPWNFNNRLLALATRQPHEDPEAIEIRFVPMWIQCFGVPTGYVLMQVCEAIVKFARTFIQADDNNFKLSRPIYFRVRVLIDINKPLKRRMRLMINDSNHAIIQFQYERMPSICLVCGSFHHTESFCPIKYISDEEPRRMYDSSIRALLRKNLITEEDPWLRDANGKYLVPTGSISNAKEIEACRRNLEAMGPKAAARMEEDENNVNTINDLKRKRREERSVDYASGKENMNIDNNASSMVRARKSP